MERMKGWISPLVKEALIISLNPELYKKPREGGMLMKPEDDGSNIRVRSIHSKDVQVVQV
jgi:hypothetical protein